MYGHTDTSAAEQAAGGSDAAAAFRITPNKNVSNSRLFFRAAQRAHHALFAARVIRASITRRLALLRLSAKLTRSFLYYLPRSGIRPTI